MLVTCIACLVLAAPPRVTSASPDHGASAVSPSLTQVRIEFDQDMGTDRWSVCGGGESFPKMTGKLHWEGPRTLVIPVSLAQSHVYQLSINCPSAQGTRSAAGEPAETTPIWFKTAADAASAMPSAALTLEQNRSAVAVLEKAVHDNYSYRDRVVEPGKWPVLFEAHRAEVESAKTPAAFARAAARVLAHAQDLHVSLAVGEIDKPDSFSVRFGTASRRVQPNADLNTLADLVPAWTRVSDRVQWGRFADGILYLNVAECSDAAADDALKVLRDARAKADGAALKGVVLDLRFNSGGDELAARRIAGVFLDASRVYSRNRYRDPQSSDGWGPVFDRSVEPAPPEDRISAPVAVLTGPYCMSSCESLLLMLKGAPRATLIGATSYGSSGNPRPTILGNGVTVFLSSWEDQLPDGTLLEGVGVAPDEFVVAEPDDFQASDPLLNRALHHLRREGR